MKKKKKLMIMKSIYLLKLFLIELKIIQKLKKQKNI